MKTCVALLLLLAVPILSGCKEETFITGGPYDRGSLVDPAVQPRVLSTYPPADGSGPFRIYNPGDGRGEPHFVIVFNKLMDRDPLRNGGVKVSGFDRAVRVSAAAIGGGGYSDVFSFTLYDSTWGGRLSFAVGRRYTVTLDTTLLDINGNRFWGSYSFSFTPEPAFRILSVEPPSNQSGVSTNPSISILFNSAVDTGIIRSLSFAPPAGGSWSVRSDGGGVYYSLPSLLALNTTYFITVSQQASDTLGNQLAAPFSSSFVTRGFAVESTSPGYTQPDAVVSAVFSAPLDTATVRQSFSIQPTVSGSFRFPSANLIYFEPFQGFPGNRTYTVTLGTGLKSSAGDSLPFPYVFSFYVASFGISYVTPGPFEGNVSRSRTLSVRFNGLLDTTSCAVPIAAMPDIPGTIRWSGSIIELIPADSLLPNQGYLITVSGSIRSAAGDSLGGAYAYTFATGP